ncbi:Histidine kinase-, DNA gyrase B-, and HSP90-like ATPase [Tsuneonella dongtanensis]|uniref:Histidine kinase-, DNA gyrase B-, and HSP90-like ATPase n=1 Tax=Tsuneonella dongtanensis TaxID=692370 RepID=A0A1B2AH14_9SPHN|nr:ATP-binding protein [Tsuneonella dongtanensis]ANY21398.1 Histidine kinase-, DNA gyrase B-, and HSP90-like ATPase [Tsuneonella dongtanensis]
MGTGKRFSSELTPGAQPQSLILSALAFSAEFAQATGLPEDDRDRLAIVIEELVSNVARHGSKQGRVAIALTLSLQTDGVQIELEDDGIAFDPTADRGFAGPDPESGGGTGLALVRAWSREFAYAREGGRNRLRLVLAAA